MINKSTTRYGFEITDEKRELNHFTYPTVSPTRIYFFSILKPTCMMIWIGEGTFKTLKIKISVTVEKKLRIRPSTNLLILLRTGLL